MTEYHVLWKGQRSGPYTENQVIEMINAGSIGNLHTILENEVPTTLEEFVAVRLARQDNEPEPSPTSDPDPEVAYQPAPDPEPSAPRNEKFGLPPLPEFGQGATRSTENASGGIVVYRGMRRIGEFSMSSLGIALEDGTLLPDDCVVDGAQHIPLEKIFPQFSAPKPPPPMPRPRSVGAAASEDFVYDLRMATSYRSFRGILKVASIFILAFTALGAVAGGIAGGIAISQGQGTMGWGIIAGTLTYAGIIGVATIFWRDLFTIVADIGDCNIRRESREE